MSSYAASNDVQVVTAAAAAMAPTSSKLATSSTIRTTAAAAASAEVTNLTGGSRNEQGGGGAPSKSHRHHHHGGNQPGRSGHHHRHHYHHHHHHHHHRGKPKHSVHWFRKGLRLSDNPSLLRAVRRSDSWRCIFVLDPWFAGSSNQGVNKWRFLLQCLEDLDRSLRKLNSRLYVVRGQPADVLPQLFKEWNTNYFTFEEDPEPYGQVRDKNIVAMCKELGITVVKESSHTLYSLDKILELNDGKPPLTYSHFIRTVSRMRREPAAPAPALGTRSQSSLHSAGPATVADDHDDRWGVPTLGELGFDTDGLKPPTWIGGETEALTRLERHLERKAWVASFGRPKMTPQSLLASTTGLSPYLRFGCLSTRLFYHALGDLYRKVRKEDPPLSLFGQLLWREFFYTAATKNPNFDRMYGNPICVQIPWNKNPEALAKWAAGKTGFPWIDAVMTQLREEGWIHHVARHATACFLTRGDLWLSWEEGMKVFDELLLDADWSVNAGTWMWLSCSSFFQQFFPLYCPVRFGRRADPNGDYVRRYLPALKNFPTRYIHEPWTAPEQVQKAARCVIGRDYPVPMVDHVKESQVNQERMRQVYQHLATYRAEKTAATADSKKLPGASFVEQPQFLSPQPVAPAVDASRQQQPPPTAQLQQQGLLSTSSSSSVPTSSTSGVGDNVLQDVDLLEPSMRSYQPEVVQDTLRTEAIMQQQEQSRQQQLGQQQDVVAGNLK